MIRGEPKLWEGERGMNARCVEERGNRVILREEFDAQLIKIVGGELWPDLYRHIIVYTAVCMSRALPVM